MPLYILAFLAFVSADASTLLPTLQIYTLEAYLLVLLKLATFLDYPIVVIGCRSLTFIKKDPSPYCSLKLA